jgi:hypothetical protein
VAVLDGVVNSFSVLQKTSLLYLFVLEQFLEHFVILELQKRSKGLQITVDAILL